MTDLGIVPGIDPLDGGSAGWSFNSKTQVVGISTTCDFSIMDAFLSEDGAPMIDLNTLIPPGSLMHLYWAFDINERGEIAGLGALSNGDTHAFLLIPCGKADGGCGDSDAGLAMQSSPAFATQPGIPAPSANPALSGRGMLERLRPRRFPGRRTPGPSLGEIIDRTLAVAIREVPDAVYNRIAPLFKQHPELTKVMSAPGPLPASPLPVPKSEKNSRRTFGTLGDRYDVLAQLVVARFAAEVHQSLLPRGAEPAARLSSNRPCSCIGARRYSKAGSRSNQSARSDQNGICGSGNRSGGRARG